MASNSAAITNFIEAPPRVSEWQRFRRVFFSRGMVVVGLAILILLFLVAIFAAWLAPYSPYKMEGQALEKPSAAHWLGTDLLGRDVLSRLIYGSRVAIEVGFVAVFLGGIVGITLGLIAGFSTGFPNMIIMRTMDALMCFPSFLLVLLLASLLGGGIQNVIVALSIGAVPGYARVTCGLTLSLRENDYVLAQKAMGAGNWRVMLRHILPNAFPPLLVIITMQLGGLILAEAGLSFLGIGIKPPGAAWGSMVNDGYKFLLRNPVLSFAPGICIMAVVFAFNMVGDGLRDALDPRLRGLI
ncbi:MAG TPA: ABC transporter permease [Dehalococcoidales bacterium]|nr:ABC transporter permease [Dehalococcoidales bacterium]